MSAFADLMDLQERIDVLTREMAGLDPRSAAYSEVLNEIGELELVLHAHNSARLRPRTESILRGLGFKDRDFDRDCGEFSGGWQMRIALAKLLLREPAAAITFLSVKVRDYGLHPAKFAYSIAKIAGSRSGCIGITEIASRRSSAKNRTKKTKHIVLY